MSTDVMIKMIWATLNHERSVGVYPCQMDDHQAFILYDHDGRATSVETPSEGDVE